MLTLIKWYVLAGLIVTLINIGFSALSGDLQEALNEFRNYVCSNFIYDIVSCMSILIGIGIGITIWPINVLIFIKSMIH